MKPWLNLKPGCAPQYAHPALQPEPHDMQIALDSRGYLVLPKANLYIGLPLTGDLQEGEFVHELHLYDIGTGGYRSTLKLDNEYLEDDDYH